MNAEWDYDNWLILQTVKLWQYQKHVCSSANYLV